MPKQSLPNAGVCAAICHERRYAVDDARPNKQHENIAMLCGRMRRPRDY
jgi:NAD-dependent SIR2 family protein deacetylase